MPDEEISVEDIMRDFERAYCGKKRWLTAAKKDYEFRMGKQWSAADKAQLEADGRPALTINRIHTIINLLYGIESQNRTDFKGFPEGAEDDVKGEIATRLMKNMSKMSWLGYKMSEQFEDGNTTGECFLEPWLDYTDDLLNGNYRVKRLDFNQGFPDPDSREYDLSDAEFFDKVTYGLTEDQLVSLFPDKEKEIEELLGNRGGPGGSLLKFEMLGSGGGKTVDGPGMDYVNSLFWGGAEPNRKPTGDLLEHYYKKYVPVYYVIDLKLKQVKRTSNKAEAEAYKKSFGRPSAAADAAQDGSAGNVGEAAQPKDEETVKIEKRMVPEIWVCSILGGEKLEDKCTWFYPRWKTFHFIPYFCYKMDVPVDSEDRDLLRQGFVRQLIDPQFEHNKRESQLLHHLNTSIGGSALEYEEDQLVNADEVKEHGSAAGAHIIRKKGTPPVKRHEPSSLSQGHMVMSDRHSDSIKMISGLDTEFLAMQQGKDLSGRAIALRQKHGLLMVQKPFDHKGRTKWIMGKFMLSQMGEVYDVDRAMKVLGENFISTNFQKPVVVGVDDGKGGMAQVQKTGPDGRGLFEVDIPLAKTIISQVLNDGSLGDYDVAVGEVAMSETIQFGNYLTLMDMMAQGIPIPPEVLIEESGLSPSTKKKITSYIEAQQAKAAEMARAGAAPAPTK
jgi:hypothetical protein